MTKQILILLLLSICTCLSISAQQFKDGERVEVAVSGGDLTNDKNFEPCEIVKYDATNKGYSVRCSGYDYFVRSEWIRGVKKATVPEIKPEVQTPEIENVEPKNDRVFKVGDRVLVTTGGLVKNEKSYEPCTITKDLHQSGGEWAVHCDSYPTLELNVREAWMKHSVEVAEEPLPAGCPFNKNYGAVSNEAPASAALFKSVIFEWQKSTQDFYDFGLTFLRFQIGGPIKNGGITVYPVKSKELICQKSSTITKRWVREIEYACYKNQTGEWVCKNGSPKYLEQTSIPNK